MKHYLVQGEIMLIWVPLHIDDSNVSQNCPLPIEFRARIRIKYALPLVRFILLQLVPVTTFCPPSLPAKSDLTLYYSSYSPIDCPPPSLAGIELIIGHSNGVVSVPAQGIL